MSELLGGERVVIESRGRPVHTFQRAVSEVTEKHWNRPVDSSEAWSDHPDDIAAYLDARSTPVIDTWVLVTPMRRRQARKYPKLPEVDPTAPLEKQAAQIMARLRRLDGRRRVNAATRDVKVKQFIGDDTFIEKYRLGYGMPDIQDWKLWGILDGIARETGLRVSRVEATELARRITARRP